jgi:chromosome segregation ATPase
MLVSIEIGYMNQQKYLQDAVQCEKRIRNCDLATQLLLNHNVVVVAPKAILELEQNVERLEKENRDIDLDLERERAAKENLEKKVAGLEKERKSLRRECDTLRDELADSRRAAAEDEETSGEAR